MNHKLQSPTIFPFVWMGVIALVWCNLLHDIFSQGHMPDLIFWLMLAISVCYVACSTYYVLFFNLNGVIESIWTIKIYNYQKNQVGAEKTNKNILLVQHSNYYRESYLGPLHESDIFWQNWNFQGSLIYFHLAITVGLSPNCFIKSQVELHHHGWL